MPLAVVTRRSPQGGTDLFARLLASELVGVVLAQLQPQIGQVAHLNEVYVANARLYWKASHVLWWTT